MAGIDHETEYNNRARVTEHPGIIAGWGRDAAAYREARGGKARLGIGYGASPRQIMDLFMPDGGEDSPLVLFIHGGYWQSLHPASFSHLARGANAHGITVAVAGYDLCPEVSVAAIIDQLRAAAMALHRRTGRRITVCGHSAGGHLAACLVATDFASLGAPPDLVPRGLAISGLFDLLPLVPTSVNIKLGLDPKAARAVSPLFWPVPPGRTLDAWVGARESAEYLRQSATVVASWSGAGAETRYEAVPDANHFNVVAPLADPGSPMVHRLVELARATG
jgi:arylformamidase